MSIWRSMRSAPSTADRARRTVAAGVGSLGTRPEHAGRADHVVAVGHKRLEEGAEPVDAYQPAGGKSRSR